MPETRLSVIIPAYNEEQYLPRTLRAVARRYSSCEVIVVDNDSTDRTAAIGAEFGARVVRETVHNIATVRNTGAAAAAGEVFVFIDADTEIDEATLPEITRAMIHESVIGGAVAVDYTGFRRGWVKWYMKGWRFWTAALKMAQGAAQFCRRDVFWSIGGYDDSIYVGEDIDFYWRMRRYARRTGQVVRFLDTARVVTSSRRFDKMPTWRLLVVTHPLFILLNWKRRRFWRDWYERAVR
ncbi:MAG TPA: glycosyltransferase [Vicinamibacterales bacterium]|jgi:glycosyltransferase involved in cell wall biosynthesis|nr:glycosyltransferase [Vicinamibacterales bacterium]